MAHSDALYVVEDWISEHYFVSEDRSGTFAARTKELLDGWRSAGEHDPGWRSPRERFTGSLSDLVSRLVDLQADAAALDEEGADGSARREQLAERSVALADTLRTVLGYTTAQGVAERWDVTRTGPLRRFATRGVEHAPLAMLDALAADDVEDVLSKSAGHLPADVVLDEGTEQERTLTTVPQVLSALSLEPDGPEFLLVLAGRFAVLTSADLWPQGRYLVADLQTVAERADLKRGGEVERMLACLSADSLAPDASSHVWWTTTREQAVSNAVGVSADLRDGVRESIEILANEVLERRRAQGLPELDDWEAQRLALQSLRYLYRILFLLYAEASPELGVVPAGAPEYQAGYSVDRLRDLLQREVPAEAARGSYLYESLQLLFRLVDEGHAPRTEPSAPAEDGDGGGEAEHGAGSLVFERLEADLFDPDRTSLLDEVGLGNAALQKVLENLLLSRVRKGRDRGFISYVALGINQLGAVYESLMSYTGSIASEDLVEVARNGKPEDGSWVVPADVVDEGMRKHLVMVQDEHGEPAPRTYRHGEFVFRLSGRARQQSASYYSPEVITSFTVSQGLAELLDPVIADDADLPEGAATFKDKDFDGDPIRRRQTTAAEILDLSICEPALGSGAFAIEAVRQLAGEYLTRRQEETGERIDPEEYAAELQRVKAYIALHNVYGVDLNPTAVELAEVSLWLDTMAPGLKAPWFGLRLRAGNSLIGARHALYSSRALGEAKLKDVVATAPEALPLATVHEEASGSGRRPGVAGKVFHFLLPGEGWFAAAQDAEIKKLARAGEGAARARQAVPGEGFPQGPRTPAGAHPAGGGAVGLRAAPPADRGGADPPGDPRVGGGDARGRRGDPRTDRAEPRGRELRLPPPPPGDGRLVRPVVLAGAAGGRGGPAHPRRVAGHPGEDPGQQPGGREGPHRLHPPPGRPAHHGVRGRLGRAGRHRDLLRPGRRGGHRRPAGGHPLAAPHDGDRRRATLLPLGTGLRRRLRPRRLRPAGGEPAVGATGP